MLDLLHQGLNHGRDMQISGFDEFCVGVVKPSRGVAFGQRFAGSVKDILPNATPLHEGNTFCHVISPISSCLNR
jgi:hypothetical protein